MKLIKEDGELYVLVRSGSRVDKERAMRRRRLKKLWKRLAELKEMDQSRDELLMRLGAARKEAGRAFGLVKVHVPKEGQEVTHETFGYELQRKKLRQRRHREGKYLIRANVTDKHENNLHDPQHVQRDHRRN